MDFIVVRFLFVFLLAVAAAYLRPYSTPVWQAVTVGAAIGGLAILVEMRAVRTDLRRLIGIGTGIIAGLLCAALLSLVLGHLGDSPVVHFIEILGLLLCVYIGGTAGAAKGDMLNLGALGGVFGAETGARSSQKILDTSVIIDGRIADIAEAGFIDGVVVIPQFVLQELQGIADSADAMRRNRGRRGLDVLQRIQKMPHIKVQIVAEDFPHVREVDMKLIELAKLYNCRIVTNDFNLNKVAQVRGVEVLNINELANSVRPVVLPGEQMRVFILKEGKEYNQGVAYLDDGTMVVVDNARRMISKTIDITVTSVLQTTAGKMIFGKFDERTHAVIPQAVEKRREQAVGEN
jgi:uncharacterized protein YacL